MNDENHKTYCIIPGIRAGMFTTDALEQTAALARKYEVARVKITGAQRIAFLGMPPDQLAALQRELDLPGELPHRRCRIHYVQACPGSAWCTFGVGDSLAMEERISALELEAPLPAKVKVGISGCRMCCCESWVRDVGLVAEKRGWRLSFGGNGAGTPRIGDVVADRLSDDDAVELTRRTLNYYAREARFKTRSARFMERQGIDALRRAVLEQPPSTR